MGVSNYLVSSLLMGALLVGVTAAALRTRAWQRYSPAVEEVEGHPVVDLLHRPGTWTALFLALVAAVLGGTVAYLNGVVVSGGTVLLLLVGPLVAFVLLGVYYTAKSRGHPHSHAVAESVLTLGTLFVGAIVVQLVTASL